MDVSVVYIDKPRNPYRLSRVSRVPRGTRPSVEHSGQRDWTCLLGAITEDGDRFFFRLTEYITAERAINIILKLYQEFKYDSIAVLDGAPYFQASTVTDLAARDNFRRLVDPLMLGVDADHAALRIEWRPRLDPTEPAHFVFHYHDSTGRDFGWHREPNPHVDWLEHYQERTAPDQEYDYEPTYFESDSPVDLLWDVLGRIEERVSDESG